MRVAICIIPIILGFRIAVSPVPAGAESARTLVETGNRQYAAGEYDQALESYAKALAEQPGSAEILFNKGNVFFKKEEFDKAREAYQAAALQTRDLSLEASAHYNLGNTLFAEGQSRLKEDPRQALSQWGQSIHHFQEALRMDPQFRDAARNLEVTRLNMKDLADRIKKAEEAAREQQQRREAIQKALEEVAKEQESETAQNDALQEKARQDAGKSPVEETRQLAAEQARTRDKTGEIADRMKDLTTKQPAVPQTGQPPPSPSSDALDRLEKAREAQSSAAEKLERQDLEDARKDQETAVQNLKEALDASREPEKGGDQPSAQQNEDRKSEDRSADKERHEPASSNPPGEGKEEQAKGAEKQQPGPEKSEAGQRETGDKGDDLKTGTAFSQSPESIFREEKENRLLLHRDSQGGIKPVEKDW